MASCAVTSVMSKDPRFQALKEFYKDKHYNDDHLAQALQLCREYHDYSDDWFPETSAQRGVFTRFMNYYLVNAKLSKTKSDLTGDSLYNLYTTLYSLYTPEQLENRISMIANDFRELVDRLQKNDNTNRSRQELIASLADDNRSGFQKIMEKVFSIYELRYTNPDAMMQAFDTNYPSATEKQRATALAKAQYRAEEYRTILKNKERLAALAATKIGEDEGFVVRIKDFQVELEDAEDISSLNDGVEEPSDNLGEDKVEGSKGDRYGDYRTLKLLNRLSVRAKRLISRIPKVDSSGRIIRDDLGVTQFIGGRQVATVLKRVLVNSSPETMMSDLEGAADFYPWIRGLIDVLNSNPDYRATIYANFKNAETTFVYSNLEQGRYTIHIANSRAAGSVLMREAGTNMQSGYVLDEQRSLYTGYGALKSKEAIDKIKAEYDAVRNIVLSDEGTKWIRMVDGDKQVKEKIIESAVASGKSKDNGRDYSYLSLHSDEAMSGFLAANPDLPGKIAGLLRGMGFVVSEKDIVAVAKQRMNKKGFSFLTGYRSQDTKTFGRNKLYQLVDWMQGVYNQAERIYKNGEVATGQNLFNTSSEAFSHINRALALAQYDEVEARVVSEGKSLSAYNNINLLHQVFDRLANKDGRSEEVYLEDLENDYLQYEGMSIGFGDEKQPRGWLRMLRDNTDNIRNKLKVVDMSAVNHVEYSQLSRAQKLTNSLVMYLEGSNTFQSDGFAPYEVTIQADYATAYNFVIAPKLSFENVVDALTDEVLIELERIASIQERQSDPNRAKLSVYERQGLKIQIFPELNNNEFLRQYTSIESPVEARNFVRENVARQMSDVIERDLNTIEEAGILANTAFKKVHIGYGNYGSLYSKNGKISELDEKQLDILRNYSANVFFAREQIVKLTTGGLEQFNGLIDYEKRNMLTHATRTSLYTDATWKGKRVGKESQNVVYLGDDSSKSAFISDIKEILNRLLDEKVISKGQFDTMLSAYSDIKTTDGQGFRTLESYRTVQIMSDQWDDRHENAYRNIMAGKPNSGDIEVFMQNIKPVLTGYEHIPAAAGEHQKPVKLTVLHKYSETVLLPLALSQALQTKSVPLIAMQNANDRLKASGKDIDMFLFHSGVKVGAHSILQPFAKTSSGDRILTTAKDIEDYIVEQVGSVQSSVHTLPFKYYGIAASTPAHAADDAIAWASQAEKVAWANISQSDKINVNGTEMSADAARELYNNIKAANIVETYAELRKLFVDSDELERIFQEELASKSYSSRELMYALAHLKDGSFALPLYSPNIEHQVQELLSSIIKKRLTKPRVKGANILQSTSLGMDVEASSFDGTGALSEEDKLSVKFEGSGRNKRIKYVEVYMPLHDSRLARFADKDGNIDAKRLSELVSTGKVDDRILNFIAYRTPSDAEHSVIPCRIKGFVANVGGATIKMPKEIMVMTGHDYDGDKMRCHFADFDIVWDEDKIRKAYERYQQLTNAQLMASILGLDNAENEIESYEGFARMVKSRNNPSREEYRKAQYIAYDYDKAPLDNSLRARNNARVELMFSELTSPAGSSRVLIPGGCEETKIIAKSLYLVRAAKNEELNARILEKLVENGMSYNDASSAVRKAESLYDVLVRRKDGELTDIVRAVSSAETPYSVKHSADAFDYIMGGAEMIGVYAMYNSAMQMMQRLDLHYVPAVTKKGKPYDVSLFGHKFDKLFDNRNRRGRLASLGLARLLNAAVDNNKEPVLGYLNQTKEMAEMTYFLFAAGLTEEDIHLLYNQPVTIELINRLKARDSEGFDGEIRNIISELAGDNERLNNITRWIAVQDMGKASRNDFTKNLDTTFDEIVSSQDLNLIENQIKVLRWMQHLHPAADNLASFARLTRPESESGSIGTSVADIITKTVELNEFRNKLASSSLSEIGISGMTGVLARRDVNDGWDTSYIEEVLGTKLPEVVALNSLMLDTSLDMLKPLFPQAKSDWVELEAALAGQYNYKKLQEGKVYSVGAEMILWKLLSNRKFITGNPQEEQRRILIDVPKQLKDLKERIFAAEQNPGNDKAADELVGNVFLQKLSSTSPENSTTAPRLRFTINGTAAEGTADLIRASWGAMLANPDEAIRQLAVDLFKYNLYTNGFTYGMYEFSHFAPFSVIMATPGYVDALRDVLKSNWKDDAERDNFINQYYMNHWGDKKFIPYYKASDLPIMRVPDGITGQIWLSQAGDTDLLDRIADQNYIVITHGENNSVQDLYRVLSGNSDAYLILEKATKLGTRNRSQQMTLQYNPTVDYHDIEPVVPGNESAWGQLDILDAYAQSNIDAPSNRPIVEGQINSLVDAANGGKVLGLSFFGLSAEADNIQKIDEKAESAVKKNDAPLKKIDEKKGTDAVSSNPFGFGGGANAELLQSAMLRSGEDEGSSEMLNIVRRDETGKIVSENVLASPYNISQARKQKVFVELNKRLREILREKGIATGTLTDAEAMMSIGGIADFDTAQVTAEGLLEMIRLAHGYEGEQALPEEFAHVALEMLGHDHPLVKRLLSALDTNDSAMREAFGDMYEEYLKRYGENNHDKLVLEAAGKLVAKNMFQQQEIKTGGIRNLIRRIVDAIKNLFRRFRISEVQNAIFDANDIASKVAREMLGGRLLDDMSITNISSTGQFQKVKKDLSAKEDILAKLLKTEIKRLSILKKRQGYRNQNNQSAAVTATEAQVLKLEDAIRKYKTEEAVINYLNDSLAFLQSTENSLDDAVNSGRPVNSICRKLNTVRDTLYSFSRAISDIRAAVSEGEIENSSTLDSSLADVSNVLQKFYSKYNSLARTYFEEMLSSVYGPSGRTITIGKEKGRVKTIHEMATKADHDISFASRWFNSLADCNDDVLKAIDDIVRDAKVRARRKAAEIRPKIEVAIADLERETGSKDQSFMFAMEKGADGKMHRTGSYISNEYYNTLTAPQQKFYDTMMSIKKEADACVPESLVEENKIIMLRKYTMDKFKDAEGAKGKAIAAWEGLKNMVMDMSDDLDYENKEVAVDFEGNKVDMLPVKFLMKGKNESYDDMTDDVATSMMAYAGMAFEFGEMNSIIGILENAKYMASQRAVVQKTGSRTQMESVGMADDIGSYAYREPFTVKQAQTRIQQVLEDFFQMHIYGHVQKDEGTIGNTRISKRGVVNALNAVTSLSQMAINLSQRIANVTTGMTQVVIESAGRGAFNAKDVAWASAIYTKESGDRLAETGKTDPDNKLSLWMEKFDVHQNNGRDIPKYKKGRLSRIFNTNLLYAGLTVGEDYLSAVTALSAAKNYKVKGPDGKTHNLWDAYEVKYADDTNKIGAYLSLKKGYTKVDGSQITELDENEFSKKVIGMNFELQGIYNLDDRSAIQQYSFGALVIMYRKWIAPAMKRRYGATQYSTLKGTEEEGYYRTLFRHITTSLTNAKDQVTEDKGAKALLNIVNDAQALVTALKVNWSKLTDYEKSNCMRSLTELGIIIGLWASTALLGKVPPQDDDDRNGFGKWWDNTVYSQLLRLRTEIGSQAPTPMLVSEATKILKSPFAALRPIQDSLNIFKLLVPSNYWTEIKSGRYKGHTKSYKYFHELPGISMWKRIDNFIDPSPLINYYKNDAVI